MAHKKKEKKKREAKLLCFEFYYYNFKKIFVVVVYSFIFFLKLANVVESRLTHQVTARGILEGFGKSNQINNYQGQVKKSTEYSPKDRNFAEEVTKTLEDAFSEVCACVTFFTST